LEEKALNDFMQALKIVELPARHVLLHEGSVAIKLYYLIQGVAKCFYRKDDKEVIVWFALDDDVLTSLGSFISSKPSVYQIELVEASSLAEISHRDFFRLTQGYSSINNLYKSLLETYYLSLEEQYREIHSSSAREKYEKLITKHPSIVQRVPLGDVASYLGITQESLSRIRADY